MNLKALPVALASRLLRASLSLSSRSPCPLAPFSAAALPFVLVSERRRLGSLRYFLDAAGSTSTAGEYLRSRIDCSISSAAYHEAPAPHRARLSVDGEQELKADLQSGRAAVLVGGHLGPGLYGPALHSAGVDFRFLIAPGVELNAKRSSGTRYWATAKSRWVAESGKYVAARRDERELMEHIGRGGVAMMHLDVPSPSRSPARGTLFGRDIALTTYPFRLAERYSAQLWTARIRRDGPLGSMAWRMELRRLDAPDPRDFEGIAMMYSSWLERCVREDPLLWRWGCEFDSLAGGGWRWPG